MRTLIAIGVLMMASMQVRADVSAAARAFADAQAAQLEGDYDRAARSFELAYSIAPSKEALRSAVRAHMQGNHLPRAATLAAILGESYGADAVSAQLATEVLAEAKTKLGRIEVVCAKPCTLAVDGRAVSLSAVPRHIVYVAPGHQALSITFEGDLAVSRAADLAAGAELVLRIDPPAPARPVDVHVAARRPSPPPPHAAGGGLPRAVPIVGGVIALGLGGVATWSGMDTIAAHDAYAKDPTPAGWSAGRSKQLRTNVLIGTAAGVGVATVLVAVFWTHWHDTAETQTFSFAPAAGGAAVSFGGSF